MPELRHDPLQSRWVIIATERSKRPSDFVVEEDLHDATNCPFCLGNEGLTPPEVYALRENGSAPDTEGWKVRVVPNKFPAVTKEGELESEGLGIYNRMNGIGDHEVVIENPDHQLNMADLPVEHLTDVFKTYRTRVIELKKDTRSKYVLIFKNYGLVAGASLSHPHTQMISTPITPRTVANELETARKHYQLKKRCLMCDVIEQELSTDSRIIVKTKHFVAFTPYASRFPFEVMVAPLVHNHAFSTSSDEQLADLSVIMKSVLSKLKNAVNDPPYNFLVHNSPNTNALPKREHYWETLEFDWHWHIEILPRLTKVAGFEWGTGFYINPTVPEDAAKFLRES